MEIGAFVFILLGGAVSTSAVCVSSVAGIVTAASEKAVQITLQDANGAAGASVWLPKSALKASARAGEFTFAKWFRPDGYQERTIMKYRQIGGVSA
jgi:hypothetical protein